MIQSSDATQPADTQVNEPVQRPSVIHHGHPDSCNAAGQDPNNDANKNMHRMQYAAFAPDRRICARRRRLPAPGSAGGTPGLLPAFSLRVCSTCGSGWSPYRQVGQQPEHESQIGTPITLAPNDPAATSTACQGTRLADAFFNPTLRRQQAGGAPMSRQRGQPARRRGST